MSAARSTRLVAAVLLAGLTGLAHAHGTTRCERIPAAEMKPQMELQKKLADEGWKVRQVKTWNNCYEVYGFDEKGKRAEAFFDPKTFERVGDADDAESQK